MTLQEQLNLVHTRSVKLYLDMQNVVAQIQHLQIRKQQIEVELLKLDGQEELLKYLLGQENNNG